MDTDLRAAAIAAGAAALLSAATGLLARVGLLALLLRMLLIGLSFGALVFGALFLLRRFLPDLFSSSAPAADEEPFAAGLAGPEGVLEEADSLAADSPPPAAGSALDLVLDDEGVRPASALGPSAAPPRAASAAQASASRAGEPEEFEEVEPALGSESLIGDEPAPTHRAALVPSSGAFDELDVLPDLDSLGEVFPAGGESVPAYEAEQGGEPSRSVPSSRRSSGSVPGPAGSDPAALAQAVRTLLKRDQKG